MIVIRTWEDMARALDSPLEPALRHCLQGHRAYHALLLDDVGTKVNASRIESLKPTWKIETSQGNLQVGYKLREPLRDERAVSNLLDRIAAAGLTDKGAKGMTRWGRLPNGINGKIKHLKAGVAFACKLFEWNAEVSYSVDELLDAQASSKT